MSGYQLHYSGQCIVRLPDGAQVPLDPRNGDYAAYLAWRGAGGTPLPADPAPPADPQAAADASDLAAFPAPPQVQAALAALDADLTTLGGPVTVAALGPILRRTLQNQRALVRALGVLVRRAQG